MSRISRIKAHLKLSRIRFQSVIVVAIVVTLVSPSSLLSAAENHAGGFVSARFGALEISSTESLAARIMPLKIEGLVNGADVRWTHFYHLDLQWASGDAAQPIWSYIRFGSNRRIGDLVYGNLDFYVRGATEVRPKNGSVCELNAWKQVNIRRINGVNTYTSQCWRQIAIKAMQAYDLTLKPDQPAGQGWWQISIKEVGNLSSEIEIGSIKVLSATSGLSFNNMSWSLTYSGDQKACNAVPSMDTLLWPIKTSGNSEPKFINNIVGPCVSGSLSWDSTRSAWLAKVGGSDPTNTNSNQANNSSLAGGATLRKARSNDTWSRPKGLLPGLSEVHQSGYFADNTNYFASAPRIKVTRTSPNSLPIYASTNEIGLNSIWWGGYFIPDETGTWDFQMTSDDASYFWLGKDAVSNYQQGTSGAAIALPGAHPATSGSKSLYLEKDKIYPMRIQFGNALDVAVFKFEVKSPSFKGSWDTNLEGLIWSSDFTDTSDCTNYGISYTLSQSLGFGTFNVPGCTNNPASNDSGIGRPADTPTKEKPQTPSFSKVNFVGNKINIDVNFANSGSSSPDKIYLVAPSLGINTSNPLPGKVSGNTASWDVDFSKLLGGSMIPLEIISERDGVASQPLIGTFQAPIVLESNSFSGVPFAPKNFKTRFVGSSVIVSVESTPKEGANPTEVRLFGTSLGITKRRPLNGDLVGSKGFIEIALKNSMAGKRYPVVVYFINGRGESKPLSATLVVPSASRFSSIPKVIPTAPKAPPKTVICSRANQTRAFEGEACPPGWEKR